MGFFMERRRLAGNLFGSKHQRMCLVMSMPVFTDELISNVLVYDLSGCHLFYTDMPASRRRSLKEALNNAKKSEI